jgi:hypothetical protein
MDTIEILGTTYEKLSLGNFEDVTHVKFAGMPEVYEASYSYLSRPGVWVKESTGNMRYSDFFMNKHSVQPLKLHPLELIGEVEKWYVSHAMGGSDRYVIVLPKPVTPGTKFQLTEIKNNEGIF